VQSTVSGAKASFTFNGTSVRWIGRRSKQGGIALVRVDGALVKVGDGPLGEVDLFSRPNEIRTSVVTLYGLSAGQHTLTIEVTDRRNDDATGNVVTVDAFEVEPQILSHLQETDPKATLSAGWVQDDRSDWSGGGVATGTDPRVGGMRFTEAAGETATLKFRGTSISWSGYRGPDAGIAHVQVKQGEIVKVDQQVDLYSPSPKLQEVVFTATGLTVDADHTLTIAVTGQRNPASTGARVVVDAFDVTTPGRRFQEWYQGSDASFAYTGRWDENRNRSWSEGASKVTETTGSRADFTFTGSRVSWIGAQKRSIGPARIYIDGALIGEVKNHQPVPIEGYQYTIYTSDPLSPGQHTITIEASGTGNVVVDAFDVRP
jgi:hypothetical protein